MLVHPDRCQIEGATEVFKSVGTAYGCLSDDQKRKMYDMTGSDSDTGGGGPGGFGGFHGGQDIDPNEIFKQFFQGGGFPEEFGAMFGGPGGPQVRTFSFNLGGGGGGGMHGFPGGFAFHSFPTNMGGGASRRASSQSINGQNSSSSDRSSSQENHSGPPPNPLASISWLAPLVNIYKTLSLYIPEGILNLVTIGVIVLLISFFISKLFSHAYIIIPLIYLPIPYKLHIILLVMVLAHFRFI